MENQVHENCAIWMAMETISPKWTIHIILELMTAGEDSLSYGDIQKLIPGINPRMLAIRLSSLIEAGLVIKILENPHTPKKVRYKLTDTGKDLVSIIIQVRRWAVDNLKPNERCLNDQCRHATEIQKFLSEHPEKRTLVYLDVSKP